jgi:hypothetical protein
MGWLIAAIIVITLIALCVAIGYWFIEAWDYGGQYISFRTFVRYYNINPNKWKLGSESVSILDNNSCRTTTYISYRFGLIGFYRYLFWHHNLENQKLAAMFEDKENKNETSI